MADARGNYIHFLTYSQNGFVRRNQTAGTVPSDVICQSVTSGNAVEINLAEACSQAPTVESCGPFYLTVSSVSIPLTPQCKGKFCIFKSGSLLLHTRYFMQNIAA